MKLKGKWPPGKMDAYASEPLAEPIRKQKRNWSLLGDEELVAFAKRFIGERGICGRGELQEKEPGLYEVLRGRKLLDEIGLGNKNADFVNWGDIPDCEMAFLARRLIAESGIGGRRELQKEDSGLYCALLKRELLDKTGLAEKHRDWAGMENNELVAHAREGIAGRRKLAKANGGLYAALLKRDLLDEIGLPDSNGRHRSWAGMGNGELVAHAKGFIAEKGIAGKEELKNSDSGLYQVLYKRKLLDAGFSDMEASRALEKEGAILRRIREALGEYSGDGR